MKKIIPLMFALALAAGCTKTSFTPDGGLKRISMFQNVGIQELIIGTNGTATLRGYGNDGGNEALGQLLKAAYSAGAASAGVPVAQPANP